MTMMRIRGVWTTNLTAFLLGAGMYSSFIIFPQFAQLPKSTGFGFGASVVASGLYLLPSTLGMVVVGFASGAIAARFGSKRAAVAGSVVTTASFALIAVAHAHPYDMLASAALLGIGIGLAFAALGNLVVQAVDASQTGAASGMNTVMRTIGGAIGGQIAATLVTDHVGGDGLPAVTGFTDSFVMAPASWPSALSPPSSSPRQRRGRTARTSSPRSRSSTARDRRGRARTSRGGAGDLGCRCAEGCVRIRPWTSPSPGC